MEYALNGITNQLFAARYQLYLPNKEELQNQLDATLEAQNEEEDEKEAKETQEANEEFRS